MNTQTIYSYTHDKVQIGPYLAVQILRMVENGTIKADATITRASDGKTIDVQEFLSWYASEIYQGVSIRGVNIPFEALLRMMLKTLVAAGFIGLLIWIVYAVASAIWRLY
jgi:hypothetical protein